MSTPTIPDDDRQRRLETAMAEYLIAADGGQPLESESFLGRYPDLRAELVGFLVDLSALAGLVEPLFPTGDLLPPPGRASEPEPTVPLLEVSTACGATITRLDANLAVDPSTDAGSTTSTAAMPEFGEAASGADVSVSLPGGTRVRYFGDYELIKELGRGGMGVVYSARQIRLNRAVALKMIKSAALASDDEVRRFQNEAESVATLDHPNIVPIYEVGNHKDRHYFAMKLVSGSGLDRQLDGYVANPTMAARLMQKAAEAVQHAHQRGILHRDLKPANIIVDVHGDPFVTDFGLAKRVEGDSELTHSGAILGTPAYMSPEQASGRRGAVTTASDVYSLGAILYALLTARAPFGGESAAETLQRVRESAPLPPSRINPRAPRDLEVICLKCLEKDPTQRYSSAQGLADDLGRFLMKEPILARPVSVVTRARFWCQRKPALASLVASLVAAVVLGITAITWYWSEALRRDEAERQGELVRQAVILLTKVVDIGFDDRLDPLQKEFLEGALQYYEQFTSRVANDPGVRLEHGRVYQQMGDIRRKLGRLAESKQEYLRSIEILEPLARPASAGVEPRRALARSRTLLGDLLVRSGNDRDQAEQLYSKALEAQQSLAKAQGATSDDHLRLGQTLKSQGDLLRLEGLFARSESLYDQAIAVLEQARSADAKHSEIRNNLALATDARGWIHLEMGDARAAEQDYRLALGLLDTLVADFPTVPRYLQSLARARNRLGVIMLGTGRLADAETHLRRELPLVERLAQDFPEQLEHRRELARTLSNLGTALLDQSRTDDAEPILRRAIEVNAAIAAHNPDDVQIRLDLAKCHLNLGKFLLEGGDAVRAVDPLRQATSISEALAKAYPDKPRYRDILAKSLVNLGIALQVVDPTKVEETFNTALSIYENLVKDYPENVDYRAGEAQCLQNLGPVVGEAGRPDRAEALYRKALTLLETKDARSQTPEWMRSRAGVLSNLGHLHRPGAEDAFKRSIALSANLAERKPLVIADIHNLAVAQNNLAQFFVEQKRLPEAEALFTQSVTGFEKLTSQAPRAIDYQKQFGYVLEKQAGLMAQMGKLAEAKTTLASAVDRQRQAMKLSRNRSDVRELLGGHLLELAQINLKLGAYKEAAANALELPNAVPTAARDQACFDAARILARLVTQVGADAKLAQAERDQLIRNYLGRAIALLRESIDAKPVLMNRVDTDPAFETMRLHPAFNTIVGRKTQ